MVVTAYQIQQYIRQAQCYPPRLEHRLVNDISHVVSQYPSLSINVDLYVSNAGVQQRLVYLGGTVPIVFRASSYNVPLRIWIMTYYPAGPPVVFVRPNQSMQLNEKHENIDSHGQVYMQELASWDPVRSSLHHIVARMVSIFSQKPPLYTRRTVVRESPPQPPPQPSPSYNSPSCHSPPQNSSVTTPAPFSAVSSEQERQHLIRLFTKRTQEYLGQITESAQVEFRALEQELNEMQKGEGALRDAHRQLSAAKKRNTEQVMAVRAERSVLERRMAESNVDAGDLPVERIIMTDPFTWQVVDCVARDAAHQDCLEIVSSALGDEAIEFATFMKETKRISRELYAVRALKLKVRKQQAKLRPEQDMSALFMSARQV